MCHRPGYHDYQRPLSINHLLGPSFIDGALQIFTFVTMNPYSELFLRCSTLATAADIKGPLGQDIIAKMIQLLLL